MKNRTAFIFVLCLMVTLLLWGCSPQRRMNRLIRNHPELVQDDTVRLIDIDTFITETVRVDTTTLIVEHDTTVIKYSEKTELKYVYIPETKEIWHEVTCIGDTVIQKEVHEIINQKVIYKPGLTRFQKWGLRFFIILVLGLTIREILRRIFKSGG